MRSIALVLTLATVTSLVAQSSSSYRITHTYTLGGDGGWDYIVPDPPNHRLFIARQNRVMVVDEDSGTLLGEVTGIQGAHGTALSNATGHGFATSGNDQSVVMFDLKTFKTLGRIGPPRLPTRTSPTRARWLRSTRRRQPWPAAGPPPHANSRSPWPSTPRITG